MTKMSIDAISSSPRQRRSPEAARENILNAAQITRFTQLCGAKVPPALRTRLDELAQDEEAALQFGIEYATRQCEELLRAGAPGLHFYTLNKAHSTVQVLKNLGLA